MFKEWLAERVGDAPGQVSRRELARRLAAQHPGNGGTHTAESHRRSIRRILAGEINPTQPTRDAIMDALEDESAPTVEDENDEGISRDEMRVWHRVNRKLAMGRS